ncbi:CynX/NimT family MFS transporter [Cohnella cellulosilytica]|uniref:CynX/NimT family MFS transporter n=1 Tax=Cohnella cellulosilytica TaxID=986710 RepID=A0ABW2FBY4_9BACL
MSKRNLIWMILAMTFVTASMRPSNTSIPPLLVTIRDDLGMSSTALSLLAVIPILCIGLTSTFAARIGRRWGAERAIGLSLLLIGAGTAMRFAANSSLFLLLTAVVAGIGTSVASPLFSSFIKRNFPGHTAILTGIYTLGVGIGASMGSGLTIPLQQAFHGSWSTGLGIWFLFPLATFVIWLPIFRRKPVASAPDASAASLVKLPVKNKTAWLLTFLYGLQACIHFIVATWLAPIAQESGFSDYIAGIMLTVYIGLQTLCGFGIAIFVQRSPSRAPWLIGSSAVMLIGVLPLILLPPAYGPWMSAVMLGVGSGGLFSLSLLMPLDHTKSALESGAWMSMIQLFGSLISGLGPMLIGALRDVSGNYRSSYVALLIMCGLLLWVSLKIRKGLIQPGATRGGEA